MRPARALGPPEPTRPDRRLRLAGAALGTLGALYLGALALTARPAVEARLRARIEEALRGRVGEVTLGPDVHVDALLRVTFGPVVIPGPHAGAPPVLTVERVKVRPRLLSLLGGRLEAASVGLVDVRVLAGRDGSGLRALVDRVRLPPARSTPAVPRVPAEPEGRRPSPTLHVRRLVFAFGSAADAIEVGPIDLTLTRTGGAAGEHHRAEVGFPSGARAVLDLRRDGSGWHGVAHASGLGPDDLPAALRRGSARLDEGRVSLEASGDASGDLLHASGHARLVADGLSVAGERVSPSPVGPLSLRADVELGWDGAERRVRLERGHVALQDALAVAVSAEARLGPGLPFSLSARAQDLELTALVAALPPALALPADAPRAAGPIDARLELAGPLLAPGAWTIDAGLDLARVRDAARRASPVALRAPFVHVPEVESGRAPAIVLGPEGPDFVPISELPVHVVRAVTASEDGGFFGHGGFDFDELKNAFAQGAEAGRVVRGGSTITQQLAKNLFLSREKTLARKVREAVLTVALEATVPKARLLEIYLNVAEWGPRLWGIGPAARHWFGKDARALSAREAAFLATVIPNPVRYHVMWDRGAPTEQWDERVNELLLKMTEQGALSEDALVAALEERLVFAHPEAVARPDP